MRRLKRVWLFILCLLLLTLGCIGQPQEKKLPEAVEKGVLTVGEENYYTQSTLGTHVGFTHYKVTETIQYQNEQVFVVEAETFCSYKMQRTPYEMEYKATEYYTQEVNPKYYKAAITAGDKQSHIECSFEQGKVVEAIQFPDFSEEKEISLPEDSYLLDFNMAHHYIFLFKTLEPQPGTEVTVSLFVPQTMERVDATITFLKEDSVLGRSCIYAEATLFHYHHKFWVTPEGELLVLEIPSTNARMELSDASATQNIRTVDLLEIVTFPSNVAIDDRMLVDYLKLRLTAEIVAEPVDKDFLSSHCQSFSGTVTDYKIDGVFEVHALVFSGPGDRYPLEEPKEYLMPERWIESDDPAIKAKAEEITRGCKDSWEASQKVAQWVYENISYRITGGGAKEALETMKGECGPHSALTVAMLRSLGIPSRIVGGIMYYSPEGEPMFGAHAWTEVLIAGEWIPFDSTIGEYGYVDATHVRLYELGAAIGSLELEVLEYTLKKPEIKVIEREVLLNTKGYYRYQFIAKNMGFGYTGDRIKSEECFVQNIGKNFSLFSMIFSMGLLLLGLPITK